MSRSPVPPRASEESRDRLADDGQLTLDLKDANEKLIVAALLQQQLTEEANQSAAEVRLLLERERLLADAGMAVAASLDYTAGLATVARLLVPRHCDWCVIDLLIGDSGVEPVAAAHADSDKEAQLLALGKRAPGPDMSFGVGQVLRTGLSELYPEIADESWVGRALGSEHPTDLQGLGARSYLCVPLKARDHVLGALSLGYADGGRRFGPADLALAEELARRASIAIDNARLYHAARDAIRLRDDVLAVVTHDLRSPLAAVILGIETLLGRSRADELIRRLGAKSLETIHRSAEHMRRLLNEVGELASIQVGRLALQHSSESIPALVDEAFQMLEPMAQRKSLQLEKRIPETPFATLCDRDRIIRVLVNLLGNALKFTPDRGRIVVTVADCGHEVRVSVSDTGPGIARVDLSKLFEPYWKGKQSGRTGTGLGLYIARGIVQAHGGRIWVDSEVGVGSTFCFVLPVQPPAAANAAEAAQSAPGPGVPAPAARPPGDSGLLRETPPHDHGLVLDRARDDEFLRMLGHELRTPLAAIQMTVELLRRRHAALVLDRHLKVIERQAMSIEKLVDGLRGPSTGSTFLTCVAPEPTAIDSASGDPQPQRALAPTTRPRRILVVDDYEDAAESLAEVLRELGHDTRTALDGFSALRENDRFHPQVVFLDLGLPGMDGFEVAGRLRRASGETPHLIALTGYGQQSARERSSQAGFEVHLVKPPTIARIVSVLESLQVRESP
jgi:signal transduction histidine kinase/ActR/RegA family two-component response regulator